MRSYRKYKNLIYATTFFAFGVAGASAAAGAGTNGLTMVLAITVSFGALLYAAVVSFLLSHIETLETSIAERERKEREREYQRARRAYCNK